MTDEERVRYKENFEKRIEVLRADNIAQITDPALKRFYRFVKERGNDLEALKAISEADLKYPLKWKRLRWPDLKKGYLKRIKVPILTVAGSEDIRPFTWDKTLIAQLVPGACHFQIQGKGHVDVVRDPKFMMLVKAFLDYLNK